MIRKAKKVAAIRKPKIKKPTYNELVTTVKEQDEMLRQGCSIMNAMQTEIKQLTLMHRTQLQIIDNLSQKMKDCG